MRLIVSKGLAEGIIALARWTLILLRSLISVLYRIWYVKYWTAKGDKVSNDQRTIRGERFAEVSETSREQIAQLGHCFVRDGAVVLTHGYSRCALQLLLMAAETKVCVCVYAHA